MDFCCGDLKKLLVDCKDAPIVIKENLSLDALGYHEVYKEDEALDLKIKYCPFCGGRSG
jgi:hypothetical protein